MNASLPRGSGWLRPGTPRLAGAHGFRPPLAPSPSAPLPFLAVDADFSSLFLAPHPLDERRVGESVVSDLSELSWTGRTAFLLAERAFIAPGPEIRPV